MALHPFFVPDFAVKISGLTMAADVRNAVTSLTYDNSLDTADMFTIQLNNAHLQFTDSALFDVGKTVEIHMGYAGELEPMMLGEITAVNPSFPESGAPMLTISGYDKSHRLRQNMPPVKTFCFMNDSLVAAQIAAENLLIPVVDPSPMPPKKWLQNTSDWAFLQELADRNYFQLFVRWDKLYFRFPRPQTEMIVLEWGKNLSSFSPRLSTSGQAGLEVVRGYDEELAQTIVATLPTITLGSDLGDILERLGSGFVQQLANLGRHVVRGHSASNFLEAGVLAKSILQQLLQGLFEGTGTCMGIPSLRAGDMVEIRGVGKRFSGKYTLSKVTHTINEGGYRTSFEVTQKYTGTLLQSLRKKISDTSAPNKRERIDGVLVGKVEDVGGVANPGKVKISLPQLSDDPHCSWVSVATTMAGGSLDDSWGIYFLPDIGDKVLVAFEQGDVDKPVVVGSVWSGPSRPPETSDGSNAKKLIKTKTGMQILFDETPAQEKLLIQDKAGATVVLNSQPGSETITLTDKAGSMIKMDSITGDIIIEAKGNLVLKSGPTGRIDLNP